MYALVCEKGLFLRINKKIKIKKTPPSHYCPVFSEKTMRPNDMGWWTEDVSSLTVVGFVQNCSRTTFSCFVVRSPIYKTQDQVCFVLSEGPGTQPTALRPRTRREKVNATRNRIRALSLSIPNPELFTTQPHHLRWRHVQEEDDSQQLSASACGNQTGLKQRPYRGSGRILLY